MARNKTFRIYKNDGDYVGEISARTDRSALDMFKKKYIMSTGFFWFEKESGQYVLRSTFGAFWKAQEIE